MSAWEAVGLIAIGYLASNIAICIALWMAHHYQEKK